MNQEVVIFCVMIPCVPLAIVSEIQEVFHTESTLGSRLEFFLSLSNKSINLFYFGFSKTQMVEERETRKEIVLF